MGMEASTLDADLHPFRGQETTMLADTLQHLNQEGELDVTDLSQATGLAPSSLYRWIAGQTEPTFTSVSLVFRHSRSPRVQQALLGLLTAGTGWVATLIPPDADIDGDGDVDADDMVRGTLAAMEMTAVSLKNEYEAAVRDRQAMAPAAAAALSDRLSTTIQSLAQVRCVVDHLARAGSKRRKCRALVTPH